MSRQNEMTASQWAALSYCDRLAIVEHALMQLASGKTRVEIRHGEQWVRYGQGSVTFLERERARLSALCNRRSAITVGRTEYKGKAPDVELQ